MEDIVFKETLKRNQVCSYYHPTFFEFEGVNTSDKEIRMERIKNKQYESNICI